MIRFLLKSKIHRATVTDARLDYVGSITVDEDLMDLADMTHHEKVLVVDVDNGARLETYVIPGTRRSGVVCLNGAAARMVHKGDRVIIMTFAGIDDDEARSFQPRIVFVDDANKPFRTQAEDPGEGELPGGAL